MDFSAMMFFKKLGNFLKNIIADQKMLHSGIALLSGKWALDITASYEGLQTYFSLNPVFRLFKFQIT